jgi:hypothetical protein
MCPEQSLQVGDRVIVSARGAPADVAEAALEAATLDPEIEALLVPSNLSSLPSDSSFGELSVVQEFLIVAGAGVTTPVLVAAFQGALHRVRARRQSPADDVLPETIEVSVSAKMSAEGVVQISVTLHDS